MTINEIIELLERRAQEHAKEWKDARYKGEERIADMHEGMRQEDMELIELLKASK
jgi:hypothetical protein